MDDSKALYFVSTLNKISCYIDNEQYSVEAVAQELSSRIPSDRQKSYDREFKRTDQHREFQKELSQKSVQEIVCIVSEISNNVKDKEDETLRIKIAINELESRQFDK